MMGAYIGAVCKGKWEVYGITFGSWEHGAWSLWQERNYMHFANCMRIVNILIYDCTHDFISGLNLASYSLEVFICEFERLDLLVPFRVADSWSSYNFWVSGSLSWYHSEIGAANTAGTSQSWSCSHNWYQIQAWTHWSCWYTQRENPEVRCGNIIVIDGLG